MHVPRSKPPAAPTLRELYPSLSEAELQEAKEGLRRYLELSLRIYEAICADPKRYARFRILTGRNGPATMDQDSPSHDSSVDKSQS